MGIWTPRNACRKVHVLTLMINILFWMLCIRCKVFQICMTLFRYPFDAAMWIVTVQSVVVLYMHFRWRLSTIAACAAALYLPLSASRSCDTCGVNVRVLTTTEALLQTAKVGVRQIVTCGACVSPFFRRTLPEWFVTYVQWKHDFDSVFLRRPKFKGILAIMEVCRRCGTWNNGG